MPFWRVLDYQPRADSPDEDLVDPVGRGAAFWFESMAGQMVVAQSHWLCGCPTNRGKARVCGPRGGRSDGEDDFAPAWWTLADAAGNEVDVATTMSRD